MLLDSLPLASILFYTFFILSLTFMLALNLNTNVPLDISIFSIVIYYLIIYLPSIISIFLLFKYSNYRIFYLTVVQTQENPISLILDARVTL